MVCSCAMPSNSVWLQIIFCSCVKKTVLFSFLRLLLREKWQISSLPKDIHQKNKLGDRMIKQLLHSVIAKYHQISSIDLLATDKSRYFGQPRPIIVNYLHDHTNAYSIAKAILREKRTNISSQDN